MTDGALAPIEPFAAARAIRAEGILRQFNDAGILSAADVHIAARLCALLHAAGDAADPVRLAAALAVRGPRAGHVFVDLIEARETVGAEVEEADLDALPWPEPQAWVESLRASPLVTTGETAGGELRPLRLSGSRLYLERLWREERQVAADLTALLEAVPPSASRVTLADGVRRLLHDSDARQRMAAVAAVLSRLTVVAGGPGTGKTTTLARIVALLVEQAHAQGERPPVLALAAPTGKAAARLQEAVRTEAAGLDLDPAVRRVLDRLSASTIHRLLGWRRGSHSRFAHDRGNRLPHEVVVIDETSMVPLSLMARLTEAVRTDARLILVGDPDQLSSIEAGVVLGDIVGPAAQRLQMRAPARERIATVLGEPIEAEHEFPTGSVPIADSVIVLERVHRYGGAIGSLAAAVRAGEAGAAIDVLREREGSITWIEPPADAADEEETLEPVRQLAVAAGEPLIAAARAGEAREALRALASFRLLCAHRRGPHGVSRWGQRMQAWLAEVVEDLDLEQRDYVGRPLLVTRNDAELGLSNGDTGVIVRGADGSASAAFEQGGEVVHVSPLRLAAVETVHAMTIHKSQGSQFDVVAVVLPAASRILTRELLYTAVTRARRRLIVVAPEAAVRAAIARPVARASGLRERLWDYCSSSASSP